MHKFYADKYFNCEWIFNTKLNNENLHNNLKILVVYNYILDTKIKNTIIILDEIYSNKLGIITCFRYEFNDNFLIL